jgi:hypothetical protein
MNGMKHINKFLSVTLLLFVTLVGCEDEMEFVDPMVYGIVNNVEEETLKLASGPFGAALVGLREQRILLIGLSNFIANDGYSGDNYDLENTEQTKLLVDNQIITITSLIDSIWDANIRNLFETVNEQSAGIQNFGLRTYAETENTIKNAYEWIKAETDEPNQTAYIANDFVLMKNSVFSLISLSEMNDEEVIQFVNDLKEQFDRMQQQFSDLAPEINSSPFFTVAQKELYEKIGQELVAMAVTIEDDLSLGTKGELDQIDRNLYSLVYFVDNNYTSPAQEPLTYGEISSITELRWLSEHGTDAVWAGNWKLTANIDAAETHRWNDGVGFKAIPVFSGKFDGQYHIIAGLLINRPPDTFTGFIGTLNGGEITNLGLFNANVTVQGNRGGVIVGIVTNGKISNSFTDGIIGAAGQSGGFVGRADGGEFENCFSSVEPYHIGGNNLGGFIGLTTGVISLKNCYATGFITGGFPNTHALIGNVPSASGTGVFFDSVTVGRTTASGNATFNEDCIDLPTESWSNLSNFPTFSPNVWEIKTLPMIDIYPRPYLKGFNYDALESFLVPDTE